MASIHQGIIAALQQQQGCDANPSPTAYFVYLLTLLVKPDASMLTPLLSLLHQTLRQMPPAAVKYAEAQGAKVSTTLLQVLRKHSDDGKAGQKAYQCVRTLYAIVEVNDAALQHLQLFEPSKFNVDFMCAYNNLMQVVFLNLHVSNSALCRSRLPLFLERTIQLLMNDAREEVATSAAETMKRVLAACIDPEMLEEDRVCPEHMRPTTTALSRILALLVPMFNSPHFQNNWDLLAGVFAVVFRRMGRDAFPRLNSVIVRMDEVRQMDDFHYSAAMERGLGAALRAIGAKNFFSILPFDALKLEEKRAYLYRVIKKYVSHDSLAYWNEVLMPMALKAQQVADREAATKNDGVAKLYELAADRLWHLCPAFCLYPFDFGEGSNYVTFAKAVTEQWKSTRPSVLSSTCHAMRLLADKNRWLADFRPAMAEDAADDAAEDDDAETRSATTRTTAKTWKTAKTSGTFATLLGDDRGSGMEDLNAEDKAREEEDPHAFHGINQEQAQQNVELLRKYSRVILPKLCNLFEGCGREEAACVLETIHSYAKVSAEPVLTQCFATLTRKVLDAPAPDSDAGDDSKPQGSRHAMLDIASGILASLGETQVRILYDMLPPLLAEKRDVKLQKKAYRVLAKLHETQPDFALATLQDTLTMLADCQLQCAPSSRLYRFQALARLFRMLHPASPQLVPGVAAVFVHEVLLAIPEPGSRMHDAAFGLLRLWGEQMKATSGTADDFFRLLMAGLDSTSSALQQCTIIALANVMVLHFADCSDQLWGDLLTGVVGKLAVEHGPTCNAVLAFCKLALKVAVYHPPALQAFQGVLPAFMDGVVFWLSHEKENRIRTKARVLVERAIKRFGFERVMELTPPLKKKFVKYVEKQRALQQRKKVEGREKEKLSTEGWVKKFKAEFFEKGKGRTTAPTGGKGSRFVMQAHSADPEDLLDPSIVRAFFLRPAEEGARDSFDGPEDNFEMTLDPTGKVLVTDRDAPAAQLPGTESLLHLRAKKALGAGQRKRKRDSDDDEEDPSGVAKPTPKPGPRGANRGFGGALPKTPVTQRLLDLKKRSTKKQKLLSAANTGKQYVSRKGAGDVLRANAADPYAYIPISAGFLNKRNRKAATSRFEEVGPGRPVKQTLPRAKVRAAARHRLSKAARRAAL